MSAIRGLVEDGRDVDTRIRKNASDENIPPVIPHGIVLRIGT